jgi:2',3'-cyclic-nucleotide 2'-phosphodiesterase (5'-nucleotidase family)
MVNLKKYNDVLKLFVIFLTFFLISSCRTKTLELTRIEGVRLPITEKEPQTTEIENFIKPYREHITKDLDSVLAYCPETLDKRNGKWQTTIGNLMADITLNQGNSVFIKRENKKIDICLLNQGGIRATLPKGNVTSRTAFNIMPFENSLVVVALLGAHINDLVTYFLIEKQPQPLSGLTFTINKNNQATNIRVQGEPLENDKVYYVGTNDYLANGGDNMNFFSHGIKTYDLNYKLRNILIDYFKEVDTIAVINDTRITVE